VRIFFLLVDEPIYTPACIAPLVARWQGSIAGAAFPKGFFDWNRVKTSVRLYGVSGVAARSARVALAAARGGVVHRQFQSHGIATFNVADVNAPSFLDELRSRNVDVIVSLNCPQRLKRPILSLPAHGCINVHFGLLPRYRGVLPIFYALLNGERSFGVTVHYMDDKLDNGDIIVQREVPIAPGDSLETLYPKGFATAADLLNETLEAVEQRRVERTPNREEQKTYYSYPTPAMIQAYRRAIHGQVDRTTRNA
jgi:methionyl-tRNA formyltransferase